MRVTIRCLLAVLGFAFLACMPALAEEVQPIETNLESAEACVDYTSIEESEAEPALLLTEPDMQPVAPGGPKCKKCQAQPWCECRYNGFPRVSCDPCCYVNDIGLLICTS